MTKYLIAAMLFLVAGVDYAHAANCSAYPYTLTNGQTADANQVMADFNNILSCGNNNLLGKNNNLSDVQSPATARTNLGLGAAAVEGLSNASAGAVTDDGAGNLVGHIASLHSQAFVGSGTFVVPATATISSVFKIIAVGGGGGGGSSSALGGGGGSGGYGQAWFYGFTPGASVTITVGGAGSGVTGNSLGGSGGSTTASYAAVTIVNASGGAGGTQIAGGAPGTFSAAVGGSGLTLTAQQVFGAQPGLNPSGSASGGGGGNPTGTGGTPVASGSGNGIAGSSGGGGSGQSSSVGANTSGPGGSGAVIVEWVL
jgi:hypothetical protein